MGFSKRGKNSYRYECQINGKRYSKTVKVYDKTNKEIKKDFERWKMELECGTVSNKRYTFQEFADIWLKDYCEPNFSPLVKFHELRHTHATLLLQEGVDVKTIQGRLGHSNITTTLNTYAHVVKELDEKAADVFEKISQI